MFSRLVVIQATTTCAHWIEMSREISKFKNILTAIGNYQRTNKTAKSLLPEYDINTTETQNEIILFNDDNFLT